MAQMWLIKYKYRCPEKETILYRSVFKRLFHYSIVLFITALFLFIHYSLSIIFILAYLIFLGVKTDLTLLITKEFAVIGKKTVWFRSVENITIHNKNGILTLTTSDGQKTDILLMNFPTKARKDVKIRKNKKVKFDRVKAKLIEKIKAIKENVVIQES